MTIDFTTSTHEFADSLIDQIEGNKKYFSKRLYRQHTVLMNKSYVKDFIKLGTDLNKIFTIENENSSFCL